MSMGVGDSSDLIHGGGGSLRVFWLSRTDFEKKLVVVVTVLSLTVVGLLVGVGVLASQNAALSEKKTPVVAAKHADPHLFTPIPTYKPVSTSTHTSPHSPTHSVTHPLTHTVTPPPTITATRPPTHSITHPPTSTVTPTHAVTYSPTSTVTPTHAVTHLPTLTATDPPIPASKTRHSQAHTQPHPAPHPHPTPHIVTHSPTHLNKTLGDILKYFKLS